MLKFHAKVVIFSLVCMILWCLELPALWRQQNVVLLEFRHYRNFENDKPSIQYYAEEEEHQAMDELKASILQMGLYEEQTQNSRSSNSFSSDSLVDSLEANALRNKSRENNDLHQSSQQEQSTTTTTTTSSTTDAAAEETPSQKKNHQLKDYQVTKTQFSDYCRFLFIAGLGGTGHHGWQTVLNKGSVCRRSKRIEKALYNLWWGPDDQANVFAVRVQEALGDAQAQAYQTWQETNTTTVYCLNTMARGIMYSYPKSNKPRHHPNVYTLALLAESAVPPVDLRLIVVHRAPTPQLVSLSIHRHFESLPKEAQQMSNQAALLNAQLHLLDPAFFQCAAYDEVALPNNRDVLQEHVVGGLPTPMAVRVEGNESRHNKSFESQFLLAEALEIYYKPRPDNVTQALQQIVKFRDGRNIMLKIDEMDMYRRYLTQEICAHSNTEGTEAITANSDNSLGTNAAAEREKQAQQGPNKKSLYWIGEPKIATNATRTRKKFLNVAEMHRTNQQRGFLSMESNKKQQNLKNYQVIKTQSSDYCRFLFVAGLSGSGHEEWGNSMTLGGEATLSSTDQQPGSICQRSSDIEKALQQLWWGKDHASDKHAASLQKVLRLAQVSAMQRWQATNLTTVYCLNTMTQETHFSYPSGTAIAQQKHHPNVYSLALLAETVSVDLRIVVLHRHAAELLATLNSTKMETENSLQISTWAQIMTNQAALLNSQLALIDPAFVICSQMEKVAQTSEALHNHIFAKMTGISSETMIPFREGLRNSFSSKKDDHTTTAQMIRQKPDGARIGMKIDEIEAYRQHLKSAICERNKKE